MKNLILLSIVLVLISCKKEGEVQLEDIEIRKSNVLIESPASIEDAFAITNVNIIPMTSNVVLGNQSLIVENGVIKSIGSVESLTIPDGMTTIDAMGVGYLIPGLMDMHFHRSTVRDIFLFAAHGVLTVREMWGSTGMVRLRDRIINEALDLPRVFVASPGMNGPNGAFEQFTAPVLTTENARELVRRYKEENFDFIKAYNTLEAAVYEAIIDEAAKVDIPVVGHVPFKVGPERVFGSGQISTEHLLGFGYFASSNNTINRGEINLQKVNQLLDISENQSGLYHVPTIEVGIKTAPDIAQIKSSEAYQMISEELRQNFESGFAQGSANGPSAEANFKEVLLAVWKRNRKIMLGTDAGFGYILPGFSIHDELERYVEAGLTNYEALITATVNPAKFLKMADQLGTIEVGKIADLVLLESNPLTSIDATQDKAGIVLRGKWLSEAQLKQILSEY